jgi:hypothetical protein
MTSDEELKVVANFKKDLPSLTSVHQEIVKWKTHWSKITDKPSTISATIKHETVSAEIFPNICTMLRITLLAPVTSATVERANSALKFVKSDRRATIGEERLNALLLLFVHRDIFVDINEVIDVYSAKHPRRMRLINPMSE